MQCIRDVTALSLGGMDGGCRSLEEEPQKADGLLCLSSKERQANSVVKFEAQYRDCSVRTIRNTAWHFSERKMLHSSPQPQHRQGELLGRYSYEAWSFVEGPPLPGKKPGHP